MKKKISIILKKMRIITFAVLFSASLLVGNSYAVSTVCAEESVVEDVYEKGEEENKNENSGNGNLDNGKKDMIKTGLKKESENGNNLCGESIDQRSAGK